MKDKEKQNISMKEMLTKRSFEPITNCNCRQNKEGAFVDLLNQEQAELKKTIIEELTRNVADYIAKCNALCNTRSCHNCDLYGWKMDCHNVYIAKGLYEQGYRKLSEDSVVLSREEYDNLKLEIQKAHHKGVRVGFDLTKYKENSIEQARKETAREILHKIYEQLSKYEAVNEIDYDCWVDDVLYEIVKQYGVDLGEEQ